MTICYTQRLSAAAKRTEPSKSDKHQKYTQCWQSCAIRICCMALVKLLAGVRRFGFVPVRVHLLLKIIK